MYEKYRQPIFFATDVLRLNPQDPSNCDMSNHGNKNQEILGLKNSTLSYKM